MNGNTKRENGSLKWPPLLEGTLVRRYKRFMADVRLKNGHVITAHCPNSGSMRGCSEPGRPVRISRQNSPKRRLKYTWEMIHMGTSWVGVNTLVPTRLIHASIETGKVGPLSGYPIIRREVPYGENSRVDLLLENGKDKCFVEVKNCTLVEDTIAFFPDAVTARGLKHLVELQNEVAHGHRSVMFYLVQRMDAKGFGPADRIDPAYGQELRRAVRNGVELLAYDVDIDIEGIRLNRKLKAIL
ncbi:MAG: DNA/RNA nuclease SfsA [Deltaproteobacteria bacterium]